MRILIVGAGSVGQLYGLHLARAGEEVHVLVRPRYAEGARRGYRLYERRRDFKQHAIFTPDGVWTDAEELPRGHFDAVILAIPSTGLKGPWLASLARSLGDATLITLTPGLDDVAIIAEHIDRDQIVRGLITSVSYPAPLPGESCPQPGTAYWFPPLTPALFEGPSNRVTPIVNALKRGHMSSKSVRGLAEKAAFGSGLLMPIVAHMETVGWRLDRLRDEKLSELVATMSQIRAILEATLGASAPLPMRLLTPATVKLLTRIAPRVPPFNFEVYLQVHFTKVGAQTRMFLDDYVAKGQAHNLPTGAIAELREQLGEA
ncbi:ketopantoate reductase family protein [Lujinxingia vulgaris]|uniref:ketopantoate reductase family protein n=1 Tax=Lujinxingia vulgaris TaxID=2600176 RepID=UPI001E5205B9|nr:2-dehydropantoate 2-reductase N-terminal domain-containing protein [Lujinxingia vulgaris]